MSDESCRLLLALDGAARAARQATTAYPEQAQVTLVVEECAELIVELARTPRGRSSNARVISECADVIIMALQAGLLFGEYSYESLSQALTDKTARLHTRLEAKRER